MNNIDNLVSLIGSLGFPIVVCLILLNYIKIFFNQLTSMLTEIKVILESLKKEGEK